MTTGNTVREGDVSGATGAGRPFHFTVVFWGVQHRRYFLDLLVASLLAPGNIPALEGREHCRFLICTTRADWDALQDEFQFRQLSALIAPVFVEMDPPRPDDNKMLVMSRGHAKLTQLAFEARANGVFVTPDLVLSDGSVAALQRRAREGYDVVLCGALRFAYEGCIADMQAIGALRRDAPLAISGRALMGIALRHLHSETLGFEWDADHFTDYPIAAFWRVPDGSGIVLHCFSWAPLLVNYAALSSHDASAFEAWTLDGDYVHANFGADRARVHVVADSDEIGLVSFTKESELSHPLRPFWATGIPVLDQPLKISNLRDVYASAVMDPLKRRIFPQAVRWHGGDVAPSTWAPVERRARAIIDVATRPPTWIERRWLEAVRAMRASTAWPFTRLTRPRALPPAPPADCRHLNQSGVGSVRALRIGPPLARGRWYWEVFSPNLGLAPEVRASASVGVIDDEHALMHEIGWGRGGWGWRADGVRVNRRRYAAWGQAAEGSDQTIMAAFDADAGKLWFGLNGHWFDGGDPATGAVPAFAGLAGPLHPAVASRHGGAGTAELLIRVRQTSWRYAPPSGFRALADDGSAMVPADRDAA